MYNLTVRVGSLGSVRIKRRDSATPQDRSEYPNKLVFRLRLRWNGRKPSPPLKVQMRWSVTQRS